MTARIAILSLTLTITLSHVSFAQHGPLDIYGYFDTELTASNKDGNGGRWGFDQHHFNLITVYHHGARYRVFGEMEWEHGPSLERGSLTGKIYLAQGFLEYKHADFLRLRVGKFASPFGIYNERHDATPTFITTTLPNAVYGKHKLASGVKDRLFAKFATGVQVLGRAFAGEWEFTYNAYVSNGRGMDPAKQDDNTNKGVGGRLTATVPVEALRLGVSCYQDRNSMNSNARQLAVGADAEWDRGPVHVEGEALYYEIERTDSVGTRLERFDDGVGWYILGAVTILDRFMPFVRHGIVDMTPHGGGDRQRVVVLGINTSLTHQIVLKNEVHFHRFRLATDSGYEMFIASVAASF